MNDNLTQQLAERAEGFTRQGGTDLHIDQVLARAGEIKRGRRMRATMLMAACLLAIAVPTALVALDRDPATHQAASQPAVKDASPISLGDLDTGDSPRNGYSYDGTWQLPVAANGLSGLRGRVATAATMKNGVMVAMATDDGKWRAHFIHAQGGTSEQSWPMTGQFAVSAEGNVAAFVEPNGTVVAVQDNGTESFELGKVPQGSDFTAVAVKGEDCSGRSEKATCEVYAKTSDAHPVTYVLHPHDIVGTALDPALDRTIDVSHDRYATYASVSDTGSCSAVLDLDLTRLWKTCDRRLLAFSPDGRHVLASGSYADGMGDSELAVLDTDTGEVVLDLTTAGQAVVPQMVWEDDTHVLATVFDQGRWAVLRIATDGTREYAVEAETPRDPYESPIVLPTR